MKTRIGAVELEIAQGDLTLRGEDAVVNAANEFLQHGGGVAEAIVRRGGALAARHVIHAVGPRWGEGDEAAKLASAIVTSLNLAEANGIRSIAFPAVSAGIFGYPMKEAAVVMLKACVERLRARNAFTRVVYCLYDEASAAVFEETLGGLAP
jgi:O-acetyl-ADP-ribose deacetylase